MQYLLSVIDDQTSSPPSDEMAAIDAFNDRLQADGHWVFAGGLGPPETATVVDHRGEPIFTDGPYAESKEYLGGFWVIEAPDLDAALELAAEGSAACTGKVEVRPVPGRVPTSGASDRPGLPRGVRPGGRLPDPPLRRPRRRRGGRRRGVRAAVERWPVDGVPPNPGAWLTTTANRKAIDRIRRESSATPSTRRPRWSLDDRPPEPPGAVDDDRLRLIFTCCHPALAPEARVALTLRLLGGLTVPRSPRRSWCRRPRWAQRITRAKAKIKAARIPYRVPSAEDLPARLTGVLAVLYLGLQRGLPGHRPGDRPGPRRPDRRGDPARPAAPRAAARRPRGGRAAGADAAHRRPPRRPGLGRRRAGPARRAGPGGVGPALIAEGHALVRECLAAGAAPGPLPDPGRGQRRAHRRPRRPPTPTGPRSSRSTTSSPASTPRRSSPSTGPSPSPSSTGPRSAWPRSTGSGVLTGYHAWHATRADLLRRLGRGPTPARPTSGPSR